jgi:hypothetical protein
MSLTITAYEQQLVEAYDECGLTVDELCAEFVDLQRESILVTLQRHSSKYNAGVKAGTEKSVLSEDEMETLKGVLFDLAIGADCEAVKLTAARFMWNEGKGRNDKHKNIGKNININVLQINQQLKQGQTRYLARKEQIRQQQGLHGSEENPINV